MQNTLQIVQNKYAIGALFSYGVGEDDRNSSRHILQLDQSGLALPTRDNYLNKSGDHQKILDAYLTYMTKVNVELLAIFVDLQFAVLGPLGFVTNCSN